MQSGVAIYFYFTREEAEFKCKKFREEKYGSFYIIALEEGFAINKESKDFKKWQVEFRKQEEKRIEREREQKERELKAHLEKVDKLRAELNNNVQ